LQTTFADAQAPDLTFRQEYGQIITDWENKHGWSLFLTPSHGDSHLLNTVRIPVTNSQTEFDEQIGCLTKLLIDSLNERELSERAGPFEEGAKGITKFDGFLERTQFPERENLVQLLRDLQTLRSSGSAHLKGSAYDKITAKLHIDGRQKADAICQLLEKAAANIRALRLHYCAALISR
jgi:hypothetical protein